MLLHQTFSWSCFCERNIGKILINVEENTSFLELAALVRSRAAGGTLTSGKLGGAME